MSWYEARRRIPTCVQHIYCKHLVGSHHTRKEKASPQISLRSNKDVCGLCMPCGTGLFGLCAELASYLLSGQSALRTGHSRHATGGAPFASLSLPTTARASPSSTIASVSCSASTPTATRSSPAGTGTVGEFCRRGERRFCLGL